LTLEQRLGPKNLDASSREHFVFTNSDEGGVTISAGSAATAIKPT